MSKLDKGWELFLDETIIPNLLRKHLDVNTKKKNYYTGAILLNFSTHNREFEDINNKEKKKLVEKIGFVPKYSWTGCAMCKSPLDTDGLYFLLDLLVNKFGGYQRIENQYNLQKELIESNYVHKIECQDYFSYFGNREISEEEQKKFEQYVPLKSYLMVDLSKTRFRTLDY